MRTILFILLSCNILLSCKKSDQSNDLVYNRVLLDSLTSQTSDLKESRVKRLEACHILEDKLIQQQNDSITRNYYFKLCANYYNLQQKQKYLSICRTVLKMSQEVNDTNRIAKAFYYIGDYHYDRFEHDSAYYYYTRAEKTYLSENKKRDILRLQFNKANILFFEKDFIGCETSIIKVLKKAKQGNNYRLIYDCYITLANALNGLDDDENAIVYYNKAYDTTDKIKDDQQYLALKAQVYNYIGISYQKQNKYSLASVYFSKALALDDFKKNEPNFYANLISNLAYSNLKLGKMSSISQLEEGLKINKKLDDVLGTVNSKRYLAEYYIILGYDKKGIHYGHEALTMANQNKIFEDELKILQLLSSIDPKNQFQYNKRFIKLSDSLQNVERATRNKYARIEYETDEILREKKSVEKERDALSSQMLYISATLIALITMLIVLMYARYQRNKNRELLYEQQRQKANEEIYKLILSQQAKIDEGRQLEKKRISQELHDGVMSRLTSTRLNLFILTRKTDPETIKKCIQYIDGIQSIEKEIRNIAHDLSKEFFEVQDSFKIIIESLFNEQNEISNTIFNIEVDQTISWDKIDGTIKMNLYRIFQESIQNINKYAKAKTAHATVAKINDTIQVNIVDDGIGFDMNKKKEGIGLKNMEERVKTIQGKLDIESEINKGTHISLIIPIKK